MSAIYLSEAEVGRALDMRQAIDAVEEVFRHLAAGEAMNVPRMRARAPGIVLHTMSAASAGLGLVGVKSYTTTKAGARFHLLLYAQASGELLAIVEADLLGQLRTGATTGVAASFLAAPTAGEMGLFGTGYQAETQLAAVAAVRALKRVFVYGRDAARREAFADAQSAALGIEVVPVDRPQEAVEDLPIVVTATTSSTPVFDGNWLAEGALVGAVGSNWLSKAEIDATTVRRADHVVCDSVAACRHEAGDFVDAVEKGIFDWSRAIELADVVAGRAPLHKRAGITLFKSVGMALEDIALGSRLLQQAKALGLGTALPF
jgi:ornithine cyclodeaminase/alanine dehydrogenase-like protein (mu-crystallin family)